MTECDVCSLPTATKCHTTYNWIRGRFVFIMLLSTMYVSSTLFVTQLGVLDTCVAWCNDTISLPYHSSLYHSLSYRAHQWETNIIRQHEQMCSHARRNTHYYITGHTSSVSYIFIQQLWGSYTEIIVSKICKNQQKAFSRPENSEIMLLECIMCGEQHTTHTELCKKIWENTHEWCM